MKTIRQIADEIGVSKTAVNKQIANLGLRSGLRKNGNQFAIDEHQEALIKQAFSEKSQTEIENQSQTKSQTENHEVSDLVCVLQATIDTLQGQLEVKDRQIEQQAQTITRLTDALAAAQQTAVAAQALHAGTIQQQLVAGEGEELQQEREALKQQGFEGLGRKQTEWKAWMEREKEALTEIAQAHEFEIISLGGGRPHMELPEYRAAAQRLEAVQEQVIAAEQEIAALEKQRKALQGNVKLLKAVEKVKPDLDAIQPEKTLTGAVKGVTVEQVKELKAAVIRGAAAEQKVRELKVENQQLQQKIPSMKEKLKEAQERQRLENENRQLKVQVEYLEKDLSWERGISARLQEGIGAVLDFLDQHLPEQFRPLVEKARELLPVPEVQQPEREQERGHTWGGMEL